LQGNSHIEIQFGASAVDVWQVDILRALRLHGLDNDFRCRLDRIGDAAGELRDGDDFIRADVVGAGALAAQENAQQPDDEIGRMEIGAQGGAVAANENRAAAARIAQKVSRGEMGVEGKKRAEKGKSAGCDKIDSRFHAKPFGIPFGFAVRYQRFSRGIVVFLRAGRLADKRAINRSGAYMEHPARAAFSCKIEHVARARHDGARTFLLLGVGREGRGVGRRVENVIVTMIGERKVGDVTLLKTEGRHSRSLGITPKERPGIAGEHRQAHPQAEFRVGPAEGCEQPLAKETGTAGDKQAFAAQFFEFRRRVAEDVFQVAGRKSKEIVLRFARHGSNTPPVIAPEPGEGINKQTGRFVLLRNSLLASALIFAVLEWWRPYFFLTDDNLDGAFPVFTEMGKNLLSGRFPFISNHLFGGGYNLLRDPACFTWHPLYLVVSLLAGTPFHCAIIDVDAFAFLMLATAGFVMLAYYLRREMALTISDGWVIFYALSFTYTMIALTTGASWVTFLCDQSALPWLVLGILQQTWRRGVGLVALFSVHQLLGGHLAPTVSNSIFLSLFALGMSISRRSWLPLANWLIGYAVALVVIFPLLIPMIEGFFASIRSHGVTLEDMQANNIPVVEFPTSLFLGMALWVIHTEGHPDATYTLALGASAAVWCLLPASVSRAKWRGLEVVTLLMMIFGAVLICRPIWITEIMMRLPFFKSMRWPFREFVQFQFFMHLFLLVRSPGMTEQVRRFSALFGICVLVIPMVFYRPPPTFNPMNWDRELILTDGFERYWDQVRPLLKPTDRIAVLIPLDLYEDDRLEKPYSLLGTFNYAALAGVVNAWGYSPTVPRDQVYTKAYAFYPFGAYNPNQKQSLMAERPELKFITLESLHPLKITLSSRDGPTIDLTSYVPRKLSEPFMQAASSSADGSKASP